MRREVESEEIAVQFRNEVSQDEFAFIHNCGTAALVQISPSQQESPLKNVSAGTLTRYCLNSHKFWIVAIQWNSRLFPIALPNAETSEQIALEILARHF